MSSNTCGLQAAAPERVVEVARLRPQRGALSAGCTPQLSSALQFGDRSVPLPHSTCDSACSSWLRWLVSLSSSSHALLSADVWCCSWSSRRCSSSAAASIAGGGTLLQRHGRCLRGRRGPLRSRRSCPGILCLHLRHERGRCCTRRGRAAEPAKTIPAICKPVRVPCAMANPLQRIYACFCTIPRPMGLLSVP
jgi:hypothetical protein